MKKKKRRRYKKRIPAHKRIPPELGNFTHTARNLYDLIFDYGLGGCWMSNFTLKGKLGCCRRSIQYARQQLVKAQVIVTARTNPHTWIMWSRFHPAVINCKVLLYPIRQTLDNPYYLLGCKSVEVQNHTPWGANFAPKSDVRTLTGSYEKSLQKEAGSDSDRHSVSRETKDTGGQQSQGSAPNSASPSGSTGNRLIGDDLQANLTDSDLINKHAHKSFNEEEAKEFLKLFKILQSRKLSVFTSITTANKEIQKKIKTRSQQKQKA